MTKNKIIFFIVFLALLALAPITVLLVTPVTIVTPFIIARLILRILGLSAFILLFVQIILGFYMEKIINKLGPWIFNFHVAEGIATYIIILLHPVIYGISNYLLGHSIDPIGVFLGFCILCKPKIELYYTFGRVAFWLLTIAVLAARIRESTPWLRKNWRSLHILNYLVFLLVAIHGFLVGTDYTAIPFFIFAVPATVFTLYIVIFKKLPELYKNYMRWIRS